MGSVTGLLRMLTPDEMERIHGAALRILEETGMWIDAEDARRYFRQAGCRVDDASKIVRFPKKVVESAVRRMKKRFSDRSDGEVWSRIRYSRTFYTTQPHRLHTDFTANTGGFPPFILDLEGRRREANLRDVIDSIRLADALPNVDMLGLPCSAQEIPHEERPIRMTAELLKRTKKIGGIEAWTPRDVEAVAEMCDVVSGSRAASLKQPIVMGYAETRTPLCFDANMSDIFIRYARLGFPQSLDCMPCSGFTAPVTLAGTIALGLAESLSGLVLGFAVNPEVRLGMVINPSVADMQTMVLPYASSDRITVTAGATQMLHEFYGCPTGMHSGKTDACLPNAQAGFEKALSSLFPVLFGAVGIGTLGNMEAGGLTYSPVQLVIDNEIVGYIRRILRGFEVNERTLAVDVIREVGPGGNFIEHAHTAENFKGELHLPAGEIVERFSWQRFETEELKGIEARALDKARKILAEHDPHPLSKEQEREIDRIVETNLSRR